MFEHVRSRIGPIGIFLDFMTPISPRLRHRHQTQAETSTGPLVTDLGKAHSRSLRGASRGLCTKTTSFVTSDHESSRPAVHS
jgi:hypothetical protein